MKLELKIQLLKFCSAVFNSIFLALGLSVAGCAVWILFDGGNVLTVVSSEDLRTVGAGLLLIGGVVAVVSVVGCVGAEGHYRFLLLMIERSLDDTVDRIILHYGENSQDRLMDNVQHYGACCGRTGPADWLNNSYVQNLNLTKPDVLPCSCFGSYRPSFGSPWCSELLNFTAPLFGRGNASYDQGCKKQLSDWLRENALTIVGMDVSLMLIQVVQFVVTVHLYRAFGRKAALRRTDPLADPDHAHLDHAPEEHLDYGEQNYGYIDPDDGYIDPAHPAHYHDYPNGVDPTHLAYHHDNQNHN
ncbi:tetraspanin-19 isoform X2 [Siniperca chuatsi]|uniref:tetraspanin-19 isoform X2 n=1 Tax=Siniperca chuatsi TaxID=119488 RepID=UPI001CE0339E|nr:tetraspanin-19 isoform X2 [Siniperca chuatsi]